MQHDDQDQRPYRVEQLVKEYAISPQEAERILNQFGSDRSELDLLLGSRGASQEQSPNLDTGQSGDLLFKI